jgi:hypothetical protein
VNDGEGNEVEYDEHLEVAFENCTEEMNEKNGPDDSPEIPFFIKLLISCFFFFYVGVEIGFGMLHFV